MEFNTVPLLSALDAEQNRYYKIPRLQFPVDSLNRSILAKDVTFYSKVALYNDVLDWRNGGTMPSGSFMKRGSYSPFMHTNPVNYKQSNKAVVGINELATPAIFYGNEFGLKWTGNISAGMASFPEYFRDSLDFRVAVPDSLVPASTGLIEAQFTKPNPDPTPYHAELKGSWRTPGPVAGPFFAYLDDHSMVTYFWYRFIDQPVFQQFNWSESKKDSLQHLVEQMHENWTIDQVYMKEPSSGNLVAFDDALLVTPPPEYSIGYVPIVVAQEKSEFDGVENHQIQGFPKIKVYPNPSSSELNIELLGIPNTHYKLQIMDINGRIIQKVTLKTRIQSVDIKMLPAGIYILNFTDGIHFEKIKFVKVDKE